MITKEQAGEAIYQAFIFRLREGERDSITEGPFMVLRYYQSGRTEWRNDEGATGLFRPGVEDRKYPPHQMYVGNYIFTDIPDSKYHIKFWVAKGEKT